MAKDERNIYTIQNDASKGEIKIADEVVAIIAGLAAMEVQKWKVLLLWPETSRMN